jgi:hypothetical protein
MRMTSSRGTANIPNGYVSRRSSLRVKGSFRQIGDVGNLDVAEALAVERDAFLDVGEQCAQPLGLEGGESLARERLDLGLEDHVLILIGAGPQQRRASGAVALPARETR